MPSFGIYARDVGRMQSLWASSYDKSVEKPYQYLEHILADSKCVAKLVMVETKLDMSLSDNIIVDSFGVFKTVIHLSFNLGMVCK